MPNLGMSPSLGDVLLFAWATPFIGLGLGGNFPISSSISSSTCLSALARSICVLRPRGMWEPGLKLEMGLPPERGEAIRRCEGGVAGSPVGDGLWKGYDCLGDEVRGGGERADSRFRTRSE